MARTPFEGKPFPKKNPQKQDSGIDPQMSQIKQMRRNPK
jgi:hypothetical protein